jgi:hypothetical protein
VNIGISSKILLFIVLVFNITYLQGQSVHFQNYKALSGRPFTLHKDLVTENLQPVSSGLIYNQENLQNLMSSSMDSTTTGVQTTNYWKGAVCYFPQAIWNSTQEKIQFAQNDENWILLESQKGGDFLGNFLLYNSIEKSILNETLGVWYFYPIGQSDRFGYWWNGGDGVSKKSSIYYIKLR